MPMPRRHLRAFALLPALLLAACAGMSQPSGSDAGRFAAALATLDTTTETLLGRIGQMEARHDMELAAIGYATGRRGTRSGVPATAATAHAMDPALAALALHGRRLAALDGPLPPAPPPPATADLLREADAGLREFRTATGRPLPDPARRQGLAAIRALAASPDAGSTANAMITSRQAAVTDAAAYLRALLGEAPGRGLRGALEAGAQAELRAEEALLGAARTDRSMSVMERYALFHRVAGGQSDLAAELRTLAALNDAIRLLPEAHAALARDDADSVPEFGAFLAATAALHTMAETPAPR